LSYLEGGEVLIDGDPIQASGKLCKAAEEVVKAIATHFNISEVLNTVDDSRWTATELEETVRVIAGKIGLVRRRVGRSATYTCGDSTKQNSSPTI
jgi:hypothetical protein